MPPPPPPPPPPPGMGGPPPPPPMANLPARPPGNRNALLGDITKGKQLKKAVTNDRSAPLVAGNVGGAGPSPLAGAPAVPKPPGGLAPPVPGGNRARSNSDQSGRESATIEQPPQLGGLFAGGMPKLKKRGGGVDTGANEGSSYASDPESSRSSAPKAPTMTAPRPPTAAPPRPTPQQPASTAPTVPSVANLRKNLAPMSRPNSSASLKGPPPPIGKKPPAPPGSRKPSFAPSIPTSQTTSAPSIPAPSAPPPPPMAAPPLPSNLPPPAPRPPISTTSSTRSQAPAPPPPPPPPSQSNSATTNGSNSLAVQAAIRAAAQASPSGAPPPPPPPPSHTESYKALALPLSPPPSQPSHSQSYSAPSPPPAAPPPPVSRAPTSQAPIRSMLDPSSYTLSSNGPSKGPSSPNRTSQPSSRVVINDPRWKFQDESMLPKPREFTGTPKRYRAGRGSSVPLDLSVYES